MIESERHERLMDHLIEMGGSDFSKSEDEPEVECTTDLGGFRSYVYEEEGWERVAEDDQKYLLEAVCIDCKVDAEDGQKHSHEDVISNKDVDGGQTYSPGATEISRLAISSYGSASMFCIVCLALELGTLNSGNLKRKCDADRHNKEQHSLNGNIYIPKDHITSQVQLLEQLEGSSQPIRNYIEERYRDVEDSMGIAKNRTPVDCYGDYRHPKCAFPIAEGTLHTPIFHAGGHNKKSLAHKCDCVGMGLKAQQGGAGQEGGGDEEAVRTVIVQYKHTAECIMITNQREERVAQTYSFGGLGEEGFWGAWGSVPYSLFDETGWQAIGIHRGLERGRFELVKREVAPRYQAFPPLIDALLQLDRKTDWRALGLRIALYDDLREKRMTQPTGIDHVIARKDFYRRDNIRLSGASGFRAAFVDMITFHKALKTVEKEVCLGNEKWKIDECITICLPDEECRLPNGFEAWILSHLPFPLIEVAETFDLERFSDGKERNNCYVTYLRNSGLISIPESSRNILFIVVRFWVACPRRGIIDIGPTVFPVYCIIDTPPENFVYIHDFDNSIDLILESVMSSEWMLRGAFHSFVSRYLNIDVNWYEIDQIVCGITTRWPRRAEGVWGVDEQGRKLTVHGLPRSEAGFVTKNPDEVNWTEKDVPSSQRYLCAADLVNSWDQTVSSRSKAEMYPCVTIGRWNLTAEMLLFLRDAKYVTRECEREDSYSCNSVTGYCRLLQGGVQRYAVEEWKSWIGIRDELVIGKDTFEGLSGYWKTIVDGEEGQLGAKQLLNMIVGQDLHWCWNLACHDQRRITQTGIRTSSSWWGNRVSRKWKKTDILRFAEGTRSLMAGDVGWYRDKMSDKGSVLLFLRWHLMKVDWLRWGGCTSYRDWSDCKELRSVPFRLSYTGTMDLYTKAGWDYVIRLGGDRVSWGWGAPMHYRSWSNGSVLTIVLSRSLAEGLACPKISDGFWLGIRLPADNDDPSSPDCVQLSVYCDIPCELTD